MNEKRLIVLYVNNDTIERFGSEILNGLKTIETRSKRALKSFVNSGIRKGDVIGIAWHGHIMGFVRFLGVKDYANRAAFNADFNLHMVSDTSKYRYTDKSGKCGILLDCPTWCRVPISVTAKHGRTWTEAD